MQSFFKNIKSEVEKLEWIDEIQTEDRDIIEYIREIAETEHAPLLYKIMIQNHSKIQNLRTQIECVCWSFHLIGTNVDASQVHEVLKELFNKLQRVKYLPSIPTLLLLLFLASIVVQHLNKSSYPMLRQILDLYHDLGDSRKQHWNTQFPTEIFSYREIIKKQHSSVCWKIMKRNSNISTLYYHKKFTFLS